MRLVAPPAAGLAGEKPLRARTPQLGVPCFLAPTRGSERSSVLICGPCLGATVAPKRVARGSIGRRKPLLPDNPALRPSRATRSLRPSALQPPLLHEGMAQPLRQKPLHPGDAGAELAWAGRTASSEHPATADAAGMAAPLMPPEHIRGRL